MAEEAPQWFKDYMSKASSGNSAGSAKTPDTSWTGKMADGAGNVIKELAPLGFGFQRLTKGADASATGLDVFSKTVSAFPGFGAIGRAFGDLGKVVLEQKTNMDLASKELGIGSNNIGKFVQMAGESGLTTQQFTEAVKSAGSSISGLAGNAQRSAEQYSKINKALMESGAGENLSKLGISSAELAEITAVSVAGKARQDMTTAAGQKAAAAAAAELAEELDASAKMSGQSREALLKTIKAEESKPNVILLEMQMTKEQLEGYKKTQQGMSQFGPAFQNLTTELASGGVRSKEGLAQMAALGPAGVQYENAVKQMTNAKTPQAKAEAEQALERAKIAILERQRSSEYNAMMQYGTAEQKAAIASQIGDGKLLQSANKAALEAGNDMTKGYKKARDEVDAQKKGEKVDDKGNVIKDEQGLAVKDEGTKSAELLNKANYQAGIQAAGMSQNFKEVNDKMGKSPELIKNFNEAIGVVGRSKTSEEAALAQKNSPKNAANEVTGGKNKPTDTSKLPQTAEIAVKKQDGGVVPGTNSGTTVTVGEKGAPEAIVPLDKLKDMLGNVSATVSSASGGAGINQTQIQAHVDKMMSKASEMPTQIQAHVDKMMSKASEMPTLMKDMPKSIPGGASELGSMFSPKIINQKAADEQKALTNAAPKTTDAAPKKEEETKKETDAKAKADADAKAKADADAKAKPAAATAKDATLKDLNDQLIALNKHMVQLINHSESTADAAHKTAKSTAKATGAR